MASDLTKINPWGLRPITGSIVSELRKRAGEYGMKTGVDNSGPRSAWMRVCSNGLFNKKSGFILGSIDGFSDTYGFGKSSITNKENTTTLGYTVYGEPHELKNDNSSVFPHRPSPGVVGIETEFFGAGSGFPGLCRKATIKWRCNSIDQLEYMFPYFSSPGVSMVIEWGWNNYDPSSLIDLTNKDKIVEMFTDSGLIYDRVMKSNGNYDCHIGKIFDYAITMNEAGGFECSTVVANQTALVDGVSLNSIATKNDEAKTQLQSFKDFISKSLEKFATSVPEECFSIDKNDESHKSKIWITMNRFQELVNKYLSYSQPTSDGAKTHQIMNFDISNSIISAHPLLKSIDENVLFPNSFSPNLETSRETFAAVYAATKALDDKANRRIAINVKNGVDSNNMVVGANDNAKKFQDTYNKLHPTGTPYTQNSQYTSLFKEFSNKFKELNLEFTYDDLDVVINNKRTPGKFSFPQFTDLGLNKSGYYGYLKDIYISTEMIKKAVDDNDSALKLVEHILGSISHAGSDIWEFRVVPKDAGDNSTYGVVDNNYNVNNKVPVFWVGSASSAHFTELTMDIKMSQEMAMQAIFGQSKYIYRGTSLIEQISTDNKNPTITKNDNKISMFTSADRLFGKAFTGDSEKETVDSAVKKILERGKTTDSLIIGKGNQKHTLTEFDASLMSSLVKTGTKASYLSSPIMSGTEINLTCLGIGGIRFLDMFALEKVPSPYASKRAIWQVEGVKNTVEGNMWKTSIMARVRPITIIP
jgi:hypothetical protein